MYLQLMSLLYIPLSFPIIRVSVQQPTENVRLYMIIIVVIIFQSQTGHCREFNSITQRLSISWTKRCSKASLLLAVSSVPPGGLQVSDRCQPVLGS